MRLTQKYALNSEQCLTASFYSVHGRQTCDDFDDDPLPNYVRTQGQVSLDNDLYPIKPNSIYLSWKPSCILHGGELWRGANFRYFYGWLGSHKIVYTINVNIITKLLMWVEVAKNIMKVWVTVLSANDRYCHPADGILGLFSSPCYSSDKETKREWGRVSITSVMKRKMTSFNMVFVEYTYW